MKISAIVAMSENRAIGKDNKLLWHLPADLAHFKKITTGKPILMGRKTYQSIGRPLPNRLNIIITRDKNFKAEGCVVVHSIESALDSVKDSEEIFVIGGAELYQAMLPLTQKIYLTIVQHEFLGDAFFPEIDLSQWREIERVRHEADEKNEYACEFLVLEKLIMDRKDGEFYYRGLKVTYSAYGENEKYSASSVTTIHFNNHTITPKRYLTEDYRTIDDAIAAIEKACQRRIDQFLEDPASDEWSK